MQDGGTASGFDLQVWGSTASSLGCFWKSKGDFRSFSFKCSSIFVSR